MPTPIAPSIGSTSTRTSPCFLYLPFNAQHAPLQAPGKYLDRFPHIAGQKPADLCRDDVGDGRCRRQSARQNPRHGPGREHADLFPLRQWRPHRQTTSNNVPLRGFKATTLEGGVRVPFCAQWKGKLPAGKTYDNPIIQLDILPTALAAAGGEVDPAWKLDGVNLLPISPARRRTTPARVALLAVRRQWAIRDGDWKLVVGNFGSRNGEFYNLAEDKGESHNLAAETRHGSRAQNKMGRLERRASAGRSSPREARRAPR